ncbi:MAG TPA: polyprenyl synthetase family protein, partial [Nonomuraea sp.]|nr:polyprenyl synthetase family protein [Nonomuraea sp.]
SGPGAVTIAEYTEMAAGKTGGLLGAAAAAGVTLGGAPELGPHLQAMGRDLGIAFQIADDILGIWGDPAVTGKPVHNDLRRDKKTLPVLAALSTGTRAARDLAALLSSGITTTPSAQHAAALIEQTGARAEAQSLATHYVTSALTTLDKHLPAAADLRTLCTTLATRPR